MKAFFYLHKYNTMGLGSLRKFSQQYRKFLGVVYLGEAPGGYSAKIYTAGKAPPQAAPKSNPLFLTENVVPLYTFHQKFVPLLHSIRLEEISISVVNTKLSSWLNAGFRYNFVIDHSRTQPKKTLLAHVWKTKLI